MPTDPDPEVIESVKASLRLVSDFETAAAVLHRALDTAKANGLGREAALAVVANVFSEPAADDVQPAVSEPAIEAPVSGAPSEVASTTLLLPPDATVTTTGGESEQIIEFEINHDGVMNEAEPKT